MKESRAGTNGAAQSAKPNQLATISERKLKANRENAKRSTGPKTPRGKAYSRMNAFKHGLFAIDLFPDFLAKREKPEEFQELLERLRKDYEPLGTAEELEVQWIAVCWWKRKRAWRYENAEMFGPLIEVAEQQYGLKHRKAMYSEYGLLPVLLKSVKKEIETSGGISQEQKDEMFSTYPSFRQVWEQLENIVADNEDLARQEAMSLLGVSNIPDSPRESVNTIALAAVTNLAIAYVEHLAERNIDSVANVAYDLQALPNGEALDKIVRYLAAIDRDLARAQDRLERRQRCRKGEPVPPPLSLRLTR